MEIRDFVRLQLAGIKQRGHILIICRCNSGFCAASRSTSTTK